MTPPYLQVTALTLFPEMFPGALGFSLAGKALENGIWSLSAKNIRDFAKDKHQTVDDSPFGGGAGMVMRPDILDAAISHAKASSPGARLLHASPRGRVVDQTFINELANSKNLIIVCGRFEGVDERVLEKHAPEEFSLGDFVLSGGELAAMALVDACVRLLPGVMGEPEGLMEESFGLSPEYAGLLEYPHYTRPAEWEGRKVPEVLVSGHHAKVREWRLEQAKEVTRRRRPDVWERYLKRETEG